MHAGGKMMELAHEFVQMGVKAVTFSGGGEPLLKVKINKIIKAENKKNFITTII